MKQACAEGTSVKDPLTDPWVVSPMMKEIALDKHELTIGLYKLRSLLTNVVTCA